MEVEVTTYNEPVVFIQRGEHTYISPTITKGYKGQSIEKHWVDCPYCIEGKKK